MPPVPAVPEAPPTEEGARRSWRQDRILAAFRATALVEAGTWIGLLIGMAFKYVLADNDLGVRVFGPIHGAAFIAYVLATCVAASTLRWPKRIVAIGLIASIPPAATWPFERFVARREHSPTAAQATIPEPARSGSTDDLR